MVSIILEEKNSKPENKWHVFPGLAHDEFTGSQVPSGGHSLGTKNVQLEWVYLAIGKFHTHIKFCVL